MTRSPKKQLWEDQMTTTRSVVESPELTVTPLSVTALSALHHVTTGGSKM